MTILRTLRLDVTGMPFFREQQVEGRERDDRLEREIGVVALLLATYRLLDWADAGLLVGVDAGHSERLEYERIDASGAATRVSRSGGGYLELAVGLVVRARWGPAFFELGWTPLMLRSDSARDDLFNEAGDNDGLFLGNPFVGYAIGGGLEHPLTEQLRVVVRLHFRIRYLASRGGSALEGDQELGRMLAWPTIGLAYEL